jgi:hypothetical protein
VTTPDRDRGRGRDRKSTHCVNWMSTVIQTLDVFIGESINRATDCYPLPYPVNAAAVDMTLTGWTGFRARLDGVRPILICLHDPRIIPRATPRARARVECFGRNGPQSIASNAFSAPRFDSRGPHTQDKANSAGVKLVLNISRLQLGEFLCHKTVFEFAKRNSHRSV